MTPKRTLYKALMIISTSVMLASPHPAFALTPEEQLQNPSLESRARTLALELRCLVCQNQSIDDSNAPFAQDLRRLIRKQISDGKSDTQIKSFLRQRYGDYILLKPPLMTSTYILWGAPFAILGLGLVIIAISRRHKNNPPKNK